MRCADCKHWDADNGYHHVEGGRISVCNKMPLFWNSTDWVDGGRALLPGYEKQLAFVQDGSDYNAILLTKADFFCAHFEE